MSTTVTTDTQTEEPPQPSAASAVTTLAPTPAPADPQALQALARRHLWLHFSRIGAYDADHEIPMIARGEGMYVYDIHGRRYLDGISALFCVNAGHGRVELVRAALEQAGELDFFPNWSYAHPPAVELAARIAALAPGDLNRVFFTSGGSEAVESAIKLARHYHKLTGHPNKTKIVARHTAYHGTSLGALSATGITGLREPYEPLTPGGCTFRTRTPTVSPPATRWPSWRSPCASGSCSRARTRLPR